MSIEKTNRIIPVKAGMVMPIGGRFCPVIGLIKTGDGATPLVDIPQMSDETWNRLAGEQEATS